MAYTKRQIVTALSILLLLALTAVAAFALHTIRYYSLPIPTILAALMVGLPAIAGLSIESATEFRRKPVLPLSSKDPNKRGKNVTVAVFILLILETAMATLSGTYLTPASRLTCPLNEQWSRLFRAKNTNTIRRIQNALECCGLHSTLDMAWPFPTKDTPTDTCARRFERDNSCFGAWRQQEQKAAGLMLLVTVLVFIWKILIVTDPLERRDTWVHHILRIPPRDDDAQHGEAERRAIEYPEAQERYVDGPAGEAEDLVGAVPTISSPENRNPTVSSNAASRD